MSTKKKRPNVLNVHLDDNQLRQVRDLADRDDCPMSHIVRTALRDYAAKRDAEFNAIHNDPRSGALDS